MWQRKISDATVQTEFIHDFQFQKDKDSPVVDENGQLRVVLETAESNVEQDEKNMNAKESKVKMRHATS